MRVLAIDTSHPTGSVAVRTAAGTVRSASFGAGSSHLVEVGRAVAALIEEAGVGVGDIDRVAVVIGPGSFTGLRVALSFAKGLYAAVGVEVVTMSGLELLAIEASRDDAVVCPMIDARRGEVYAAVYRREGTFPLANGPAVGRVVCVAAPRSAPPREILASIDVRPVVFVGSGSDRFRPLIEGAFGDGAIFAGSPGAGPSTPLFSRVAEALPPLGREDVRKLEPFYIRPGAAELRPLGKVRTHDRHPDRSHE